MSSSRHMRALWETSLRNRLLFFSLPRRNCWSRDSFSSTSVIRASVVSSHQAIEVAFCNRPQSVSNWSVLDHQTIPLFGLDSNSEERLLLESIIRSFLDWFMFNGDNKVLFLKTIVLSITNKYCFINEKKLIIL